MSPTATSPVPMVSGALAQDILYWNPAFYLPLSQFDLDRDRADYYGHGRADCHRHRELRPLGVRSLRLA